LVWIILTIIALLGLFAWLALSPMTIPREPAREGEQKGQAVIDYARMGRSPLFKFERLLVINSLKALKPRGTMLDIGCGPGYLAYSLKRKYCGMRLIGLDINAEMLNFARQRKSLEERGLDLVLANAEQVPLAENSLDFVVTSLSLHHWAFPENVFREINRVLKPGGRFLVFDLRRNSPRLFYWMMVVGQLFSPLSLRLSNGAVGSFWSSYTPSEISQIIEAADFIQFTVESHFGWMVVTGSKPCIR
jgi:ubiquinone/menaquinone biosynthesis C-methylase UbiE